MGSSSFNQSVSSDRRVQIRTVIEDCATRRCAGENLSDAEIIESHQHLLPELRTELHNLALIDRARRRASSSNGDLRPRHRSVTNGTPNLANADKDVVPDFVPGYEFIERIGHGGQGVVFRALHTASGREVAIKFMGFGAWSSSNQLSRFSREIRVLARLRHPNIVAIHDCGTAAGGSLYLVMDYVEGLPLDDFITKRGAKSSIEKPETRCPGPASRTETRAVLALFLKICDAVASAHVRGVIHRDLKPSNILVDRDSAPHVLDFGLAKLSGDSTDAVGVANTNTAMTTTGQFVGSLPWASPEQAAGTSEVDLRTDVYSLGVMLFFAMTGQLPYEAQGTMPETLNRIIHSVPKRPSAVRKGIDSDVDTIVLKCLAKEPLRRYQSAGEIGRDIQNYLDGRAIEARRDSPYYVFRKTVARHKIAFGGVVAAISALAAFAGVATVQAERNKQLAVREQEALQSARQANAEMAAARDAAAAQRTIAEEQAEHAEGVTAFLVDMLGLADPDVAQTPNLTMEEMLARASPQIANAFAEQPKAEVRVRAVIGRAYATLGDIEAAHGQLHRAWTILKSHPDFSTREIYAVLCPFVDVLREIQSPIASRKEAELLSLLYKLFDEEFPTLSPAWREVRTALRRLGEEPAEIPVALARFEAQIQREYADNEEVWLLTADLLHLWGNFLQARRFDDLAEPFYREFLSLQRRYLGESNSKTALSLRRLIDCLIGQEKFVEAESLARESEAILRENLAKDHWYLAIPHAQIGRAILEQGRDVEAEALLVNSYEVLIRARGANSPHTMFAASALIALYDSRGDFNAAQRYRDGYAAGINRGSDIIAWSTARPVFGPAHRELVDAFDDLAALFYDQLQLVPEKLPRVLAATSDTLRENDPRAGIIADLLRAFADRYINRGGATEPFRQMLAESLRLHRLSGEPSEIRLATTLWWLSHTSAEDDPERGLEYGLEALALFQEIVGDDDWMVGNSKQVIAGNLTALGRYEEAARYATEGYESLFVRQGSRNVNTYVALGRAIDAYGNWGHADEAAPLVEKTLREWITAPPGPEFVYNHGGNASSVRTITELIFHYEGFPSAVYEAALELAERAAAARPDEVKYARNVAIGKFRVGRVDEALATFRALREDSESLDIYAACFESLALQERGDILAARELRNAAITTSESAHSRAGEEEDYYEAQRLKHAIAKAKATIVPQP